MVKAKSYFITIVETDSCSSFQDPQNAENLAAELQKLKYCTKIFSFDNFKLFFLQSTFLSHHLAVIFKKIYQHLSLVILFELGVTWFSPNKKEEGKDVFVLF